MRKYTVLATLAISPGMVLGLTAEQAGLRTHALKPLQVDKKAGMGAYEVTSRIEFKRGEEIYAEGELSKHLAAALESAETSQEKVAAQERAAAAAQDLADLQAKAKQFDELQPELEVLRAKAAQFDALPPADASSKAKK